MLLKNEKKLCSVDLLRDIFVRLFELIYEGGDCCTATCLGLTCSSLYSILKTFFPGPINIKDEEVLVWDEKGLRNDAPWEPYHCWLPHFMSIYWLGGLLEDFMGSEYRLASRLNERRPPHPVYLKRSVYGDGDTPSLLEKKLEERYMDYHIVIDWAIVMTRLGLHDLSHQMLCLTPDPFGKGESWYDEVWEEVGKLPQVDEMPKVSRDVENHWQWTFAYQRLQDQWIWKAYGEWVEMTGF
jgi:hypothetical protein